MVGLSGGKEQLEQGEISIIRLITLHRWIPVTVGLVLKFSVDYCVHLIQPLNFKVGCWYKAPYNLMVGF